MVTALLGLVRIMVRLADSLQEKGHESIHMVAAPIETRYNALIVSKVQSK
jgi:hypothetical protein